MGLSSSLIQFRLMIIVMVVSYVHGKGIKLNTRVNNQERSIAVIERDVSRNIVFSSLGSQGRTSWNLNIRKREALEHPHSGEVIRLRSSGKSMNSGKVEVYKGGKWGYVCEDGWDLMDASVVCREIGFTRGAASSEINNGTLPESQKSNTSILFNDLQCSGTENTLHDCPYSLLNDCSHDEAASVECSENIKCPKNWRAGFNKCYKFYTKAKTIQHASSICANDNATLVVINSMRENHFLSNFLHKSLPHIHQWYTAGQKNHNVWQWKNAILEYAAESLVSDNMNQTEKSVPMDLPFTKWFPGWPSYSETQAEPRTITGYDCLTLSNVYKDPFNKTSVLVDYFYWKADKCYVPDGMNFICQMTMNDKSVSNEDCYTGDGSSYRGNVAVTQGGHPCQKWSLSYESNQDTHPGKGLGDHNFCRNPNGRTQPWCWVDHKLGTFALCQLKECSSTDNLRSTPSLHSANVTVELVGGGDKSEGIVEVIINNERYRVCNDNWNDKDAAVVCRMMGYSVGGVAANHSLYSNETANIVMDDVDCNGTETDFSQCSVTMDVVQRSCDGKTYAAAICSKNNTSVDHKNKFKGTCGHRPFDVSSIVQTRAEEQSEVTQDDDDDDDSKMKASLHQARIIGGQFVQHGSYPWQVRFHILTRHYTGTGLMSGYHHCGGAILNAHWVLSAAHCFDGEILSKMVAIVGDHDQTVKDMGEQLFTLQKVIIHELYNDSTKSYDIALVKIKPTRNGNGIEFNNYVQPVCLPRAYMYLRSGLQCTIAGWGYLNRRVPGDDSALASGYPNILKAIEIPIINDQVCARLYTPFNRGYSTETMLCAGNLTGGTDSCDGDSGGPLVCKISGAYTVVGITSWGRGCAMPNMPGVYAKVSSFVSWITKTISLNSNTKAVEQLPPKP